MGVVNFNSFVEYEEKKKSHLSAFDLPVNGISS